MSDYTPTTEEVRMAYESDPQDRWFSTAAEWTGEEFDRWLAEHDREVKAEAWDECMAKVEEQEGPTYIPNPYRETEQ